MKIKAPKLKCLRALRWWTQIILRPLLAHPRVPLVAAFCRSGPVVCWNVWCDSRRGWSPAFLRQISDFCRADILRQCQSFCASAADLTVPSWTQRGGFRLQARPSFAVGFAERQRGALRHEPSQVIGLRWDVVFLDPQICLGRKQMMGWGVGFWYSRVKEDGRVTFVWTCFRLFLFFRQHIKYLNSSHCVPAWSSFICAPL